MAAFVIFISQGLIQFPGHKDGSLYPIYIPEHYGKRNSQHPFDPYSFTHILHGVLLFYLWQWMGLQMFTGFIAMFALEFCWETLENSPCIIAKYRSSSGTSADYKGDSYQNSLGDLLACQGGYILSCFFSSIGMPSLSVLWCVVTEVCLLVYMRDSLTVTCITLFFPIESIRKWQGEGVMQARIKDEKFKSKSK